MPSTRFAEPVDLGWVGYVTGASRGYIGKCERPVVARWLMKAVAEVRSLLDGPIVRNAIALYGSTIVTSLLGFFYWFVAARMVSASAVGTASAIQSTAQLLSIFCVLGISTLLISELAIDRTQARSLILTAAILVGVFSLLVSAIVGIGLGALSNALRPGLTNPLQILVFTCLGVLSTVVVVLDDACIGLLRGELQFKRNTVFAASKLLLLPVLIVVWPSNRSGTELVVAWLVGLVISVLAVGMGLRSLTRGQRTHLDFERLVAKRRLIVGHHSLNLSIQSPRLIIPVLVATIVGPQANAAFTVAFLVVSFVNIIPSHLSTVLFALAPGDEVSLHREVRKTMRICLILALASAPFFVISAGVILGFFGPLYEIATAALAILGFTTFPLAIKAHYVAVARVRGRMQQAALATTLGACLEVGLAAVGASHGLTGVAIGYLTALLVEAIFFFPLVLAVIRTPPMAGNDAGSDVPAPQSNDLTNRL